MKRLIMLAVLCAFVLSAAAASAADIKASGTWAVEAVWSSNWDFLKKADTDRGANSSYQVYQRATTSFEFIANENLKGVLQTRYGTERWGNKSFALGNGDSGSNTGAQNRITVRQAYLDFNWPDTTVNVRAGYQGVSLPAAIGGGSMILDDEIGSAVVTGSITDNISYLVGYARAVSGTAAANNPTDNAFVDAYIAALPLAFEGFDIKPFFMYAPMSNGLVSGDTTANMAGMLANNASNPANGDAIIDNAWWLGTSFSMDLFDPFVLKADFNYGKVDASQKRNEKSGWLFDMALEYKGFDFMTPEVFFAYTSGEDGNASKNNGSERMPILAAQNWAVGSFFFGGDTLLNGSLPGTSTRPAQQGFWVLGLSLKDIQSFAEGLTHTAHILYAKGTNDKDTLNQAGSGSLNNNFTYGRTLTEKDSLTEIDFNTAYKIYDELTMTLDLGYLNLSTKENRWENTKGYKGGDAWKVSTGVVYKF